MSNQITTVISLSPVLSAQPTESPSEAELFRLPEMTFNYFSNLDAAGLKIASVVCKTWYELINQTKHFQILMLLDGYKTVIQENQWADISADFMKFTLPYNVYYSRSKISARNDITNCLTGRDFNFSLTGKNFNFLYSTDDILTDIIKVQSYYDRKAALATAELIENPFQKVRALLQMAKVDLWADLSHDLITKAIFIAEQIVGYYKDQAFLEIGQVIVLYDPNEAKALVPRMGMDEHKNQLLVEIVKVEALRDLKGAKISAKQIQIRRYMMEALFEIIKVEALLDLNGANETFAQFPNFDEIQYLRDRYLEEPYKDQALIEIIKVEASHDLNAAKKKAALISNPSRRLIAFLELAKIDPLHDLGEAKTLAETLLSRDNSSKYKLFTTELFEFIEVLAFYDLHQAKTFASLISDPMLRCKAFIVIAKVDPEHDLSEAKAIAAEIPEDEKDELRNEAFSKIVDFEIDVNPSEAKHTIKQIETYYEGAQMKADALLKMASQLDKSFSLIIAKQ